MKVIFIAKNKKLVYKVKKLINETKIKTQNIQLEARTGDIFEVHKKEKGYICTASSDDFDTKKGLDADIRARFPEDFYYPYEFLLTHNLMFLILYREKKANVKMLQRALSYLFLKYNNKYKTFYINISSVVNKRGGLDISDFIYVLKKIMEGDYRGVILKEADLKDANLFSANLEGADLRGANLSWANLSNANLSNANLEGANLSNTNLKNANLYYANLLRANLNWAHLPGANLKNANLQETEYDGMTVSELIEKFNLKVDKKGYIILYKKLQGRKSPIYGDIYYSKGKTITEEFCNFRVYDECASGLHVFATRELAENYENYWVGGDNVIRVKVYIGDIVAIPRSGNGKIRVKKLKVLD